LFENTKYSSTDDLLNNIGNGSISITELVKNISLRDTTTEQLTENEFVNDITDSINVLGVGDLLTRLAKCCTPIKGTEIIGYITRNRGVTIHDKKCTNILSEQEIDRFISVSWGLNETLYSVRIYVEAIDRVGLLKDITSLLSDERINISGSMTENRDDNSYITLNIFVTSMSQLNSVFTKIENIKSVLNIKRLK
jgi:guanosine-3',5'-bis(diphosphate) 3'-pyrophosphohydrolase